MLSQLEDEAQLALVLSHELVHVEEEHGLDGFIEALKIENVNRQGVKKLEEEDFEIETVEKNRYSREQELEADEKGLQFFLNTNYSFETLLRFYDVLKYAYLPYDEIPFDKSFLERLDVQIPADYLLEEVKGISPEEDEKDGTHPALFDRHELLRSSLRAQEERPSKLFVASEEESRRCQYLARMELLALYLQDQALSEALYVAFLNETVYGKSLETKQAVCKSLYGWAKFDNYMERGNISSPIASIVEGESQQLFNLMQEFSKKELIIIAIAYIFETYSEDSDNKGLREMIVDLFSDLSLKYNISSLSNFHLIQETDTTQIDLGGIVLGEESQSKVDKINRERRQLADADWDMLVFSSVLENNEVFENLAKEGFELAGRREAEENERKNERRKRNHTYSLGIDKVVLLNPVYLHLQEGARRSVDVDYFISDERSQQMLDVIDLVANLNEVDVEVLNVDGLAASDTETFNDIVDANEWIKTQFDAEEFLYQGYSQEEMRVFAEKHDTLYLMKIGVLSVKQRSAIRRFFNGKADSFIFVVVFDVRNGRRAFLKTNYLSYYINDTLLKSELYDAFYQLSKTD